MNRSPDILIIRQQPQAEKTARKISDLGFYPFVLPLTVIEILDFILPVHVPAQGYDAVIATSSAAFLSNRLSEITGILDLPLYCVGEKTAEAAKNKGFRSIVAVRKNAEELVGIIQKSSHHNFLYLAGYVRRPVLEKALATIGKRIEAVEVYKACIKLPDQQALANLPDKVDVVLVYSALSASALPYLDQYFSTQTRFLCLSDRIMQALSEKYRNQAIIAETPDENGILDKLRQIFE